MCHSGLLLADLVWQCLLSHWQTTQLLGHCNADQLSGSQCTLQQPSKHSRMEAELKLIQWVCEGRPFVLPNTPQANSFKYWLFVCVLGSSESPSENDSTRLTEPHTSWQIRTL